MQSCSYCSWFRKWRNAAFSHTDVQWRSCSKRPIEAERVQRPWVQPGGKSTSHYFPEWIYYYTFSVVVLMKMKPFRFKWIYFMTVGWSVLWEAPINAFCWTPCARVLLSAKLGAGQLRREEPKTAGKTEIEGHVAALRTENTAIGKTPNTEESVLILIPSLQGPVIHLRVN